jgi:N-carbamoyl-L-amino-acid hydrolase
MTDLDTLASFSDTPSPAITRVVYSRPDLQARAWFKVLCSEASLEVREDAIGNTFARWNGREPELPAIGTGSHIDAIPSSGRYDGTVGVLGGLQAIRTLQESGFNPKRSIELLLFTSEEPTRFGIGCLGSRMLSGVLSPSRAAGLRDASGRTLDEIRREAGFTGGLADVALPKGYYAAFVELHIEQGPILEREGVAIGGVTSIAAPAAIRLLIEGNGGHAGAVLMPGRKDALLGAAEIALAVEAAALATGAIDTVGTTGLCEVFPGAVNSIPSRVRLEIDTRDTDLKRRDSVVARIMSACDEVAGKRGLLIKSEVLSADAPAQCDPGILDTIERACEATRHSFRRMVSRAYHDSLFISRIAPVGMIFIPCRGGVSHRPDEYSSPEQIASGVSVLTEVLADLAS